MSGFVQSIVRKLLHPMDLAKALSRRTDVRWLLLRNQFSSSAVATGGSGPVVSLTTYGKRAGAVHLPIESIARGSTLPSRLILWLDDETLYTNLPATLVRLRRRGLEIKLCRNYGPHKKYYPYVESQELFSDQLVTADDDVIYPRDWLAGLISAHSRFPNCVNCYRARVMQLKDGRFAPYREWPMCNSTEPSYLTMSTGVSGVIYPASFLGILKSGGIDFEMRCPRNDDLWLHVQAIRSGYRIRQIQSEAIHFPEIRGSQVTSLFSENVAQDDGNDRQIALTYEPRDLELLLNTVTVAAN
jgi:hypothetical protein